MDAAHKDRPNLWRSRASETPCSGLRVLDNQLRLAGRVSLDPGQGAPNAGRISASTALGALVASSGEFRNGRPAYRAARCKHAIILLLTLLSMPSAGPAAPLPLTAEEASILKAGAAAAKKSPVLATDVSDAATVAGKLASEGQVEALDLILSEESDYLLNVYLNRVFDRIFAADIERRLRANYNKPLLAAQLLRAMKTYESPETFQLLLEDVMPYAANLQHEAMRCKLVITVTKLDAQTSPQIASMGAAASNAGISPLSPDSAQPSNRATASTWCKDEDGQWHVQHSYMSPSALQVRNQGWAALDAITRTDLKGIEADLLKLAPPLSFTMASERRGPELSQPTSSPLRRKVPPLNILKLLGERGYLQAQPQLTALLQDLISQGPPYSAGELSTFAGIVASMDTPQGSAAASKALVAIANTPETPQRNAAMESLIRSLGEVHPPAQVDLATLKERLTPLVSVSEDKARISRAFDVSIRTNAALREPNADYAAALLKETSTLSRQARYVIERIADANLKTSSGETLLNAAAGNLEAQTLLLARGADPNLPGDRGFTALHSQVAELRTDPLEGARLLLARGAKVNAVTSDGSTPLHLALPRRQGAVARVLIDAGADVNAEDNAGKRPLTIAYNFQNEEMQALIRERGGTEAARDRKLRMQQEKHITRHYSIRTVRHSGAGCDWFTLGRVCQRLAMREADEIEVLSPREMRLTFYSGKTLIGENSPFRRTAEREQFTAVVRDREVVETQQNLQVVDWRNAGCEPLAVLVVGGKPCWDERRQLCEKWGTHESEPCVSRIAGFKIPRELLAQIEPLPRTPTGKVQKFRLVERYHPGNGSV